MSHFRLILILVVAAVFGNYAAEGNTDEPNPVQRISVDNMDGYADFLTPGHAQLLKHYSSFRIQLHPIKDLPYSPKTFDEATADNRGKVVFDGVTNLNGYRNGIPFPQPTTGIQVLWNQRLRFRGGSWNTTFDFAEVKPDKSVVRMQVQDRFFDARPIESGEPVFRRLWKMDFPDGRQETPIKMVHSG